MAPRKTQTRHDAPARKPLANTRDLMPPVQLTDDEQEQIRHAVARGDNAEVEAIIAAARKRAGQTVTLDASEVERLRVVAERYNANPEWNATPPSDVELHAMKSLIARIDGAKYAERNPHARYICGVVVGSIARDARKRTDQARRDSMADLVHIRDLGTFELADVARVFAKWDGKASIDTNTSGVTVDTTKTSTPIADEKSAARIMVSNTENASGMSRTRTNTNNEDT